MTDCRVYMITCQVGMVFEEKIVESSERKNSSADISIFANNNITLKNILKL